MNEAKAFLESLYRLYCPFSPTKVQFAYLFTRKRWLRARFLLAQIYHQPKLAKKRTIRSINIRYNSRLSPYSLLRACVYSSA